MSLRLRLHIGFALALLAAMALPAGAGAVTGPARSFVQVWVPPVASGRSCFARFELVTHDGTLLAVADSPRFAPSL